MKRKFLIFVILFYSVFLFAENIENGDGENLEVTDYKFENNFDQLWTLFITNPSEDNKKNYLENLEKNLNLNIVDFSSTEGAIILSEVLFFSNFVQNKFFSDIEPTNSIFVLIESFLQNYYTQYGNTNLFKEVYSLFSFLSKDFFIKEKLNPIMVENFSSILEDEVILVDNLSDNRFRLLRATSQCQNLYNQLFKKQKENSGLNIILSDSAFNSILNTPDLLYVLENDFTYSSLLKIFYDTGINIIEENSGKSNDANLFMKNKAYNFPENFYEGFYLLLPEKFQIKDSKIIYEFDEKLGLVLECASANGLDLAEILPQRLYSYLRTIYDFTFGAICVPIEILEEMIETFDYIIDVGSTYAQRINNLL